MNPRSMTRMYGNAFGFNTDRRVKPVHLATGFFVALLGRQYEQQILNKTVAFSQTKNLEGDYSLPALHRLLLSEGRISGEVDLGALQILRKHLRCLANNDDAVYPAYTGKAGFGCDYSTASADVLTKTKDNDGFSGLFVFSVLSQTEDGKIVLETARTWLVQNDSTWRSVMEPLLESDAIEEDSTGRYESKGFGELAQRRLKRVAKKMAVQTEALLTLCRNADEVMASETKLRVLIVGLCLWLFRYLVLEGVDKPNIAGIALVDMSGESSSKMRSQSRWSFARIREGLIDAFARFHDVGRFEDCEDAWKYVQAQLGGRPKFEEFYRELSLRSGLAQPRSSRIAAKHFELQPETARVVVMSVLSLEEGMIPITDLLDRMFDTWGLCFGGRPNDGPVLTALGYTGLDQDQDLTPNTEALTSLLSDLGLATRFSDGLVMCHAKDAF
jgi:hypothetical protein